jgi:hypothetical protein
MALGGGRICIAEFRPKAGMGAAVTGDGTGNPVPAPNKNEGVEQRK